MKIRNFALTTLIFIVLLTTINFKSAFTQPRTATDKPARILFLIDASSSMTYDWKPQEIRFKAAYRIISAICDSIFNINNKVSFALRGFGTQYPSQDKNCTDSRLIVNFSNYNSENIKRSLLNLRPYGYSPIAYSLQQAAEYDFIKSDEYAYSIILLTDGGESCGGDICATVENMLQKKISFKPYILSLVDDKDLNLQYDCLGEYISIIKEDDIEPAIQKILNDNREILKVKPPTVSKINSNPVVIDPPKNNVVIPPIVDNTKVEEPQRKGLVFTLIEKIQNTKPKKHTILIAENKKQVKPTAPKMNLEKYVIETPPINKQDDPPVEVIANVDTPEVKPKEIPQNKIEGGVVQPVEFIKREKVNGKEPFTKTPTEQKLQSSVVTTEPADETKVVVRLVGEGGKQYYSEPKLLFYKAGTKTKVNEAFRHVKNRVITPIAVEAGTFDIVLGSGRHRAENITIQPNMLNTVTIYVSPASLAFYYPTNEKRPVIEYTALVSNRFERGPVTQHACDKQLYYTPGNYHIEINTLPPMMLYLELEENNLKLVSIPETGLLQFTNTNRKGRVELWYLLGDRYVLFYQLNVNGNLEQQNVELRPGIFQARYIKNPSIPNQRATVVPFKITSNMKTNIWLE